MTCNQKVASPIPGYLSVEVSTTAPDELAVALRGRLRRRCVNTCMNRCNPSAKCPKSKCLFSVRPSQFLATLKIMDYSLLVGMHDVERAEQEEMEVEAGGDEEEYDDGMGGGALPGSFGTPPDSPGNPLNFGGFFGPGEFDPSVDVYAIKSHDGKPVTNAVVPMGYASTRLFLKG